MDCSLPGPSVHGNSPGKNPGVGCHALLHGIFPTQGSNPGLPHFRWILYDLSHHGSPWIPEWIAYPFSRESSQPRNPTGVSCTAGRFFTSWATREAHSGMLLLLLLLSRFSHVQLCATPQTAAHQAPPSLGFSRQEHRSGLPFPSPMHKSEKGKWSRSVVPNSLQPHGLQPTRLLRPWDFPGKSTGVGCHCFLWVGCYTPK